MVLALGGLDSKDNSQDHHRPISALLCIRYLALQTAVVDRLICGIVGNHGFRYGDFRPEKNENVEADTRKKNKNVGAGARLARCRGLRSAHKAKPRSRWGPEGEPELSIQSAWRRVLWERVVHIYE